MQFSKETKYVVGLYLAGLTLWFVGAVKGFFPENQPLLFVWEYFYTSVLIIGSVFVIKKAFQLGGIKTEIGQGVGAIGVGIFSWSLGNLIWNHYVFFLKTNVPFPSWSDLFYFVAGIFWIIGHIKMFKATKLSVWPQELRRRILVIVIPVAIAIFSFYLLFGVIYHSSFNWHASPLEVFLSIYYPFVDVVVLSLIVRMIIVSRRYFGQQFESLTGLLFIGFIIEYLADFSFAYTTANGTFFNGIFVDVLFDTALVLVCVVLMNVDQGLGISAFQRTKATAEFQQFVHRVLVSMQDMRLALEEICREMAKQLKVGAISIYLRNDQTLNYDLLYGLTDVTKSIDRKDQIIYALAVSPDVLILKNVMRDQRQTPSEGKKEALEEILQSMVDKRFNMIAPIPLESDFQALIAVGPKLLADDFKPEEIKLFSQTAEELADMIVNKYAYESAMARAVMGVQERVNE